MKELADCAELELMTDQLEAVFQAAGIEPVSPGGCVWDLQERGLFSWLVGAASTLTPEIRRQIIDVFLESPHPVLLCTTEDPTEDEAEVWTAVSPGIWRLNRRPDADLVLGTEATRCGNWVLLVANELPADPIPDLIRAPEHQVLGFMRAHRIHALVDSFHDDVHWRVAVAP